MHNLCTFCTFLCNFIFFWECSRDSTLLQNAQTHFISYSTKCQVKTFRVLTCEWVGSCGQVSGDSRPLSSRISCSLSGQGPRPSTSRGRSGDTHASFYNNDNNNNIYYAINSVLHSYGDRQRVIRYNTVFFFLCFHGTDKSWLAKKKGVCPCPTKCVFKWSCWLNEFECTWII